MAETFLSRVIEKLVVLLGEEVNLLKGVQKEVRSLKRELEILLPFLRDAEAKSEKGEVSDATKVWLKHLREEADRIEDIVDVYVYQVEQHRRSGGFIAFLRKAGRSIKALKPRFGIASEIQDIQKSLGETMERGKNLGLRPFEQGTTSFTTNVIAPVDPRLGSLFMEKDEFVGIESASKELVERLVKGPSTRSVISLVGEGGIGKTTLIKNVYDDEVVKGHFDCCAWITVSQTYDTEMILKTMKSLICPTVKQPAGGINTVQELIKILRQYLQTKRYVVIFDDVWETNYWDVIKHALPSSDKGNRIIITTRSKTVAESLKGTPSDLVQELKPWSQELAWELFCKKAFRFKPEGRCPQELEQLSRAIVSKCQGLPLVIAAVAGSLSTKEEVDYEWQKVLENLTNSSILKILAFSYHDLPYHLKPCYLYFGIFPEDYKISERKLYRLWIAEGFIKSGRDKTQEQVAEEYLTELIHRNLVSVELICGFLKLCWVHDLMREIILTVADELWFCQTLNESHSRFEEKSRRISIYPTAEYVLKSVRHSRIRSIFLFNMSGLTKSFVASLFENFKLLKLLDFERAPLDSLPEEVGNLFHLKYLSLRRTNVKIVPKSIGKLRNLETLNLSCTLVQALPVEISELRKLRHLIAFQIHEGVKHYGLETYLGVRIQGGIGKLEELQTLTCPETYPKDVGFVQELERLRKLEALRISGLTTKMGKALGTSIEKMKRLKKLHLISKTEDEILDLQSISSPPPCLQYLSLHCQLPEFPSWIPKIQNLRGLNLCFSRLMVEPLKCLKGLPNLAYLSMYQAYGGEELRFEEGGFEKLRHLRLLKLEGLKVLIIDRGALPLLEEFDFGPCPLMKEMPSGVQHLPNLKSLGIYDMPREFVAGLQPDGGADYCKIQHVPSVRFPHKHNGQSESYKLGSSDFLQSL